MPDESKLEIDPVVRAMTEKLIREGKGSKRARVVLEAILRDGSVSTEELEKLGYRDAASAARDVRNVGIPLETKPGRDANGKQAGRYVLGRAEDIVEGRFHGRLMIPPAFKRELLQHYGHVDWLSRATMPATALTADHRIPFRVAGDPEVPDWKVEDFMPLDKSSQRLKSWACEACENYRIRDSNICRGCYWAYPEAYEHIAMQPLRRTDVAWQGSDVALHDRMKAQADAEGIKMPEMLLRLARRSGA